MAMTVEIKNNKLCIEIDLEKPTPSSSGKTTFTIFLGEFAIDFGDALRIAYQNRPRLFDRRNGITGLRENTGEDRRMRTPVRDKQQFLTQVFAYLFHWSSDSLVDDLARNRFKRPYVRRACAGCDKCAATLIEIPVGK